MMLQLNRLWAGCSSLIILIIIFEGCASNPEYRSGLNALEKGDYLLAVDHLENAKTNNPQSIEVSIALERARRSLAEENFAEAERCFESDDPAGARRYLESAVLYDPGLPGIHSLSEKLKNKADAEIAFQEGCRNEKAGNNFVAQRCFNEALRLNPTHEAASQKIRNSTLFNSESSSQEYPQIAFDIQDMPLGDVFDALSSVASVNLLIDDSVDRSKLLTIHLVDVDVFQAMADIASTFGLMIITLNSDTRILSMDTLENRDRYGREDVRLFPLQYADAERIRELLEPIVGTAVILADKRTNSVVVRTRSEQMFLVADLVRALDIRESEVLVEVEILEVTRGRMEDLGLNMGENASVRASLGGLARKTAPGGTLSLADLNEISGGQVFVTVPSLYLNLMKKDSRTKILAQPRLRILNRTQARLHIGEQIPIKVTSSLFRNTSEELSSFQYRDVGIVMNLTPRILSDTELALDLKLIVSSILKEGEQGQPSIGTREVETTLRLRHGEVEIIAGLIKDEERTSRIKIPFLGDIPVLGRLFASVAQDETQTDIVVSLTPHILDRRTMQPDQESLWHGEIGSERKGRPSASPSGSSLRASRLTAAFDPPIPTATDLPDPDNDSLPSGNEDVTAEGVVGVAVSPLKTIIQQNTDAVIQIEIENAINVGSVPFYIDYDPTLLEVTSVKEGLFMGSDSVPTVFMYSVDERRGRIVIGLSRLGSAGGINGSGTLVEIAFKGNNPGVSPVAFSHESVLDPNAQSIPAQFTNGEIAVVEKSTLD